MRSSYTSACSNWIVNVVKRPIFVEHQHKALSVKGPSDLHWQHRMFLSLTDLIVYISMHDSKLTAPPSDASL